MLNFALSLMTLLSPQIHQPKFPGQCEDLVAVPSKKGFQLQRVRRQSTKAEVEAAIRATAAEMGADPQLLLAIAAHESTMSPGALHILAQDRNAGQAAWMAATYSKARVSRCEAILATGPSHPQFYPAKLSLWRMGLYQNNPFWHSSVELGGEKINVWTYGYGLYGMAPVLYVRLWDTSSPPWVLCDPVVATATLVWALRGQKASCGAQGEKGTVEQVIARYATGKCGKKINKSWKGVLTKTKKVVLGNKWKQDESDRGALLEAISKRLELAEG